MFLTKLNPINRKTTTLRFLFLLFPTTIVQPPCTSEAGVIHYLDGKTFADGSGMKISYSNISSINTYGITITNKQGIKFTYFNCDPKPRGSYCDIYGMSPSNGENYGFRAFKDRLAFGYGH